MVTARQIINSTKPKITKAPKGPTQLGSAGYDNPRDDIEKTKKLREGSVNRTPTADIDIANKKYVDDEIGSDHPHQDVTTTASPTFQNLTLEGFPAIINHAGGIDINCPSLEVNIPAVSPTLKYGFYNTFFGVAVGSASLGVAGFKWTDLHLSGNANIDGNIDLGTNIISDGNLTGAWTGITNLTASATIQAEHLKSTDDIELIGNLATVNGNMQTLTGRWYSGDGTALLPSYTFAGDTNTGMWTSAEDNINFSTGGVERLEIANALIKSAVTFQTSILNCNYLYHIADGDTGIIFGTDTFNFIVGGTEAIRMQVGIEKVPYILTVNNDNEQYGDFRVKGQTDDNLLYTDSSADSVGIGIDEPHSKLEVAGAISSATATLTDSSDNYDVSGINILFVNIAANKILGGLTGGVDGQVLHIVYKGNYVATLTLEDTEGVGTQDLYMHTRADETLDGGGITFVCDGSNWYDSSHARHV